MDKTLIGLLSGASALALLGGAAEAASLPVEGADIVGPARSFAELLDPIPNAANILKTESELAPDEAPAETPLVLAQYYHHHHHHHIIITTITIITTTTIIGGAIGIIITTDYAIHDLTRFRACCIRITRFSRTLSFRLAPKWRLRAALLRPFARGAENMAVCAVENRVCRRGPFRSGG